LTEAGARPALAARRRRALRFEQQRPDLLPLVLGLGLSLSGSGSALRGALGRALIEEDKGNELKSALPGLARGRRLSGLA
jgi:hypothetical protein